MTKLRWLTEKKHWLRPTLNPIAHYCKKLKFINCYFPAIVQVMTGKFGRIMVRRNLNSIND